jgi:putative DNA modification/repair radical SAM protein
MERLLLVVKKLRTDYRFHGYIHLKGIPRADEKLTDEAARYVDRMSYNIEFPSEKSLKLLAPQKSKESLLLPMKRLTEQALEFGEQRKKGLTKGYFLPAGQTTQMIIAASPEPDGQVLRLTQALYRKNGLKRVYYSSYVPVVRDALLPEIGAGQLREHRLYQADWLLRFYGFSVEEIVNEGENLAMEFDPKCAWALRNMHLFPVEISRAPLETLLRVPGIGAKNAYKIIEARKYTKLSFEDLIKMRVALKRAKHFITCDGKFFGEKKEGRIRGLLMAAETQESAEQLNLFGMLSNPENGLLALHGQL